MITYMTQRSQLDTFLAEQAVEAGATFFQREGVKSVERQGNRAVSVSICFPWGDFVVFIVTYFLCRASRTHSIFIATK